MNRIALQIVSVAGYVILFLIINPVRDCACIEEHLGKKHIIA